VVHAPQRAADLADGFFVAVRIANLETDVVEEASCDPGFSEEGKSRRSPSTVAKQNVVVGPL